MVNGNKRNGMIISEKSKQKIISHSHDPVNLISMLKTWGHTAREIAELIESNLLIIENNN